MRGAIAALVCAVPLAAPAPSAAQSGAMGVTRQFVCFFHEGSAQVGERCGDVLSGLARIWDEMANGRHPCAWRGGSSWICHGPGGPLPLAHVATLEVHGYAPDAETDDAGSGLSRRRAEVVADMLRDRGVSETNITLIVRGREVAFIPGEPRNPQNHAVVVRLR